jgi:hypothetical protein
MVYKKSKIEMTTFWDVAPCSLVWVDRCFRGAYCLQHERKINKFAVITGIFVYYNYKPGSSVSIRAGRPGDRGSIPGRGERIFPAASVSRPSLGPSQPPVQLVYGALSPGVKRGRGMTLTTHPHLVPRSKMSRNYKLLSTQASSLSVVEQV